MRSPMANPFASRRAPACAAIATASSALWPVARTSASHGTCSHSARSSRRATTAGHGAPAVAHVGLDRPGAHAEADGTPGALERLAQRTHDARQPVRADVRPPARQDLGRRAVSDEHLQDTPDGGARSGARVELAVRVGTGAALPKAVVAVGIDPQIPLR